MRIDSEAAERVVVRSDRRGTRKVRRTTERQPARAQPSARRRLLRALHDLDAKYGDWSRYDNWSERREERPVVDERPIAATRRTELIDAMSAVARLGLVARSRSRCAEPFRLVHEQWRQGLSEEVYRWPEHDDSYAFFLYAAYEDRGLIAVGLRDGTTLVIAPGTDAVRVVEDGCARCGRPVMPELTPWLRPAADVRFCCLPCERGVVAPHEAWEIEETLAEIWEREHKVERDSKTLHLYEPMHADWVSDYGRVLGMAGVDVLATAAAQLRAGPQLGIVMLVDGAAFLQKLERYGPSNWYRVSRGDARTAIRRTPFARRNETPGVR